MAGKGPGEAEEDGLLHRRASVLLWRQSGRNWWVFTVFRDSGRGRSRAQLAAVMACHQLSSVPINNTHVHFYTEKAPATTYGVREYLQKISEEKSVLFARMVGAITTWINPPDETLTACLAALSAVLQGCLQGDPGPRWCLQPSKESGLETLIMQQVTGPEQSHHNMSQGINNMLEKFPTCLHIWKSSDNAKHIYNTTLNCQFVCEAFYHFANWNSI